MKNLLTIVVLSSLLIACEKPIDGIEDCVLPKTDSNDRSAASDNSQTDSEPVYCEVPERNVDSNLTINITLRDFNTEQEEKIQKALDQLLVVINSQSFKERVLAHTYNGKISFANNQGLTNQEIYDKIMLGAEVLSPEENQQIDMDITLYYANNSTVGYTYPDETRVWMNNKYFKTYTLAKVAKNVSHEWSHKLGFKHDSARTEKRKYSVPYGIGKIIQELIEEMTPELPKTEPN